MRHRVSNNCANTVIFKLQTIQKGKYLPRFINMFTNGAGFITYNETQDHNQR